MLPVSPEGFIVPPQQCDPYNPFAIPSVGPLHPHVEQNYRFICGMLINEISSTAQLNPVRRFCYNLCARNNWYSQEFSDICRIAHDRIVYYLASGRMRDFNQAMSSAVTEIPAAYAGHLFNIYPELRNYCDPNLTDVAWKNSSAFDNILVELNNMNEHLMNNRNQQSGQYGHNQQYGHTSSVPTNSMVANNSGGYHGHHNGNGYYPNQIGHNNDPTNVNRGTGRFNGNSQHSDNYHGGHQQQRVIQPQQFKDQTTDRFSHRYGGMFTEPEIEELNYADQGYPDPANEVPVTGPVELYVNNGTEMQNSETGITFHGVFFPIDFTGRYKKAVEAANELANTLTTHMDTDEDEIILQEHHCVIVSQSLSEAYVELQTAKRLLHKERNLELMYRGTAMIAREIYVPYDITSFLNDFKKVTTMSNMVSFLKEQLASETMEAFDFVSKVDSYLRQRVNHWLKHNLLSRLRIDGVCEDWADILHLLQESVSATAAQLLSKFGNSIVNELKVMNEEYQSVQVESVIATASDGEVVDTLDEVAEPKARTAHTFLVGEFVSITQTFTYNKELGHKFEEHGSIPTMETAPVLTTLVSSISNYRKAAQVNTSRDFFVTADGTWYEYVLNHDQQKYIVYPANFSFM